LSDTATASDTLRHIFERVVVACMANGLIKGEGFAVDASALAKTLKTIDRKRGAIGNPVIEIELAEPSVGEMQLDLLAPTALVS
jgi:hypothetical protein